MASGRVARGGWCPLPTLAEFSAWMNTFALAVPALSVSVTPWPKPARGSSVDTSLAVF